MQLLAEIDIYAPYRGNKLHIEPTTGRFSGSQPAEKPLPIRKSEQWYYAFRFSEKTSERLLTAARLPRICTGFPFLYTEKIGTCIRIIFFSKSNKTNQNPANLFYRKRLEASNTKIKNFHYRAR